VQWLRASSCRQIARLVGRRARIDSARLDTDRPSPFIVNAAAQFSLTILFGYSPDAGDRHCGNQDQSAVCYSRFRGVLKARGAAGVRDLALFSTAIDTMLHGHNLLALVVADVQSRNGSIRPLLRSRSRRERHRCVARCRSRPRWRLKNGSRRPA
jgi:hypothetical protein